jgi:hypothetical protein
LKNCRIIFTFPFFISTLQAQELDKIGRKDAVKISGGLTYSSIYYDSKGITARRQPFTYFVSGNVSANVIGINLPFTFNYSNNQIAYTQSYNVQSFNPSYKWIKGYAGITSMNFSQYTLSGHIFTGGGIELSPKSLRFAALYGRFKKATEYDFENNSDANMVYRRIGWGMSAGYEKGAHLLKVIYFSAKDDPYSLKFIPPNCNITPMENTVVSVVAKTTVLKQLSLQGEYALSGLTRNINSPLDLSSAPGNRIPILFNPNATSQFFSACKVSAAYRLRILNLSLNYEKVAPDYKTLGAYYFNNDLENITVAPTLNLLKGKLNFSMNTGLQRNNLSGDKLNTTKRWVGSINVAYSPDKHWNFSGSYSNFSSYTKQRPQNDPFYRNSLDTLNFYQLSQNGMASINYNFGKSDARQNIILMANYLVSGQKQGAIKDPGTFGFNPGISVPDKVLNGNVMYSISFSRSKSTLNSGINVNASQILDYNNVFIGPTVNFGQGLLNNKLKISLGSTYNQVFTNQIKSSEIFNHRFGASYAPKMLNEKTGKFNFILSVTYIQKLKGSPGSLVFSEFTGNFGLSYNF